MIDVAVGTGCMIAGALSLWCAKDSLKQGNKQEALKYRVLGGLNFLLAVYAMTIGERVLKAENHFLQQDQIIQSRQIQR